MQMTKKVVSVVLAVMMVVSMMAVMSVATASAQTLSDVDTAIRAGGNVVLEKNYSYNGSFYVPANVTTTIDLAGYTLKASSSRAIIVDGSLTINDSVGTGQIISGDCAISIGTTDNAGGASVTINGGSITAQEASVICFGPNATVNINGGTYTSKDNAVFMANGNAGNGGNTWTITAGTFNGSIESENSSACGIYACNDDVWNVTGGTFNITNGAGVVQRAGTVNIGGDVVFNVTGSGTGKVGDSNIVVPNGTAVVYDNKSNYPAQSTEDGTNVTGGTFNTETASVAQVKADDSDAARIEVSGGSFEQAPADEFVDHTAEKNVVNGRTYYGDEFKVAATAAELKAAFNEGGKVVLGDDIDLGGDKLTVPAGKTVVFDLAGNDITTTNDTIANFGNLTINDSVGGGKLYGDSVIAAKTNSVTVVNGGEFESPEFVIYTGGNHNATITINDGTFTATANAVFGGNGTAGYKDNTWNINGGTFNSSMSDAGKAAGYTACGIYAPNDDVWNVNGGTFNITDGTGIVQRAGVVNVADGVVFNVTGDGTCGKVGDSNVVVPTGTALVYDSRSNYPGQDATDVLNVTGGTFNATVAAAEFVNATADTNQHIAVAGGTFDKPVADDYVANGFIPKKNADGTYGVKTGTPVAKIGDVEYKSLEAAIAAAQTGDTITVLKDVYPTVSDRFVVPADKDITISITPSSRWVRGSIENHGKLKLTGNGQVRSTGYNTTDGGGYCAIYACGGSNTTIEGITVRAGEAAVLALDGAKVTIQSGNFYTIDNGVLMTNGSTGRGGNEITVNGGTFNGKIKSAGYVAIGIYAANNDTWNINGGTFNITNGAGIVQRAGTVNVADGVVINTTGNAIGRVGDSRVVVPCSALVYDSKANYPAQTADAAMNVSGGTFKSEVDAVTYVTETDFANPISVSAGSFSSEVPEDACAVGFVPSPVDPQTGMYTVVVDPNPLNHENHIGAITASQARGWDSNLFGLSNDMEYLAGTILGVQEKAKVAAVTSQSGQETGNDVRFIAVLDTNILRNADDYGFVLAKVNKDTNRKYSNTNFENLKANFGNGEKTISARETFNNVCGDPAYGDPNFDTDYKYITCAVNGVADNEYVVARFYVTLGGKTYYAKYAGHNGQYTGCMTGSPVEPIAD